MAHCSNCGQEIDENANFCPKCGTKTLKGRSTNVLYPTDQLSDAFYNVGLELEKAFNMAAKDIHSAVQKTRQNLASKPAEPQLVCPKCGSKNPSGSVFCNHCGSRIATVEEESHAGGI